MVRALKRFFERLEPHFLPGGKWERYYASFEAAYTFLFTPGTVTRHAAHVRDGADLKRIMITVWFAVLPAMLFGMYNVGLQANLALAHLGLSGAPGWRGMLIETFGGYDPSNVWHCFWYGAVYFLPIYIVTLVVGGSFEALFATVRKHEINEGFLVTSVLYALTLPPTIPLWMVGLGIAFAVVLGKEVFGGTGKNFLNPALVGRAFLFFAYPAAMSGDKVWVAIDHSVPKGPQMWQTAGLDVASGATRVWEPATLDAVSGATALGVAAQGGMQAIEDMGWTWLDAFIGRIPGSVGETSTLAILLGALVLIVTGIGSWRIMAGVVLGTFASVALFNTLDSGTNPMFAMPFHWHLVLGGFAFGTVFMATDPVSAAMTNAGKWWYGALIGFMVAMIRVVNPAFPEGMMLAILFANVFAPTIDYFVVRANIRRRERRYAAT